MRYLIDSDDQRRETDDKRERENNNNSNNKKKYRLRNIVNTSLGKTVVLVCFTVS